MDSIRPRRHLAPREEEKHGHSANDHESCRFSVHDNLSRDWQQPEPLISVGWTEGLRRGTGEAALLRRQRLPGVQPGRRRPQLPGGCPRRPPAAHAAHQHWGQHRLLQIPVRAGAAAQRLGIPGSYGHPPRYLLSTISALSNHARHRPCTWALVEASGQVLPSPNHSGVRITPACEIGQTL